MYFSFPSQQRDFKFYRKGFSTKGNMLDHNRLHNDTNPFVCNKCGLHFKWKQSLGKTVVFCFNLAILHYITEMVG